MNNLKLIELVRGYTYIYDMTDYRYSDNQLRDDAWKEIGEILQIKPKDCKRIWATLRDAYRRSVKKQKEQQSGEFTGVIRRWRYEKQMSFLLPYMRERSKSDQDPLGTFKLSKEENHSDIEENGSDDDIERTAFLEVSMPEKSSLLRQTTSSQSGNRPKPKRAKFGETIAPQSTSSETPPTSLNQFVPENKTETNDIQQFFDSVATTVQTFPLRDRAVAKAKVFSVISEMELEILSRDSNIYSEYVDTPETYNT
ncbi:transcription factor Adf-1-like [Sitophilus oryzae]|uniref:Transcription factor Adf-1-like n=1 Tax=Sitophilus oryzae TaxID=7048 RepID=A0A6J2XP01_SITOR|nr:transcription factor Adf-1-like [Sitophilus oryzae]